MKKFIAKCRYCNNVKIFESTEELLKVAMDGCHSCSGYKVKCTECGRVMKTTILIERNKN